MIKLDINKNKNLNFEVKVNGIDNKELHGNIRLEIDGIEYGFQAVIEGDQISINIPPLKNIINRSIKENEKIKARLDIVGNGYYIQPWSDEFIVENSVMVEAKLIDNSNKQKPIIEVKETENKKDKVKHIKEKEIIKKEKSKVITDSIIFAYMKKKGIKEHKIQEALYNRAISEAKTNTDKRKILIKVINFLKDVNIN